MIVKPAASVIELATILDAAISAPVVLASIVLVIVRSVRITAETAVVWAVAVSAIPVAATGERTIVVRRRIHLRGAPHRRTIIVHSTASKIPVAKSAHRHVTGPG